MEDTVTLTKRFLWSAGCCSKKEYKEREVEAERINNSSAQLCWKDEKWIILEEDIELKGGACFVKIVD